jgi:hypothetical protein
MVKPFRSFAEAEKADREFSTHWQSEFSNDQHCFKYGPINEKSFASALIKGLRTAFLHRR